MLIVNRHCYYSNASGGKERPPWFNRERFFLTLQGGLRPEDKLIIVLDEKKKEDKSHFVYGLREKGQIIEIQDGTEAGAFCQTLDIIRNNIGEQKSVYIVEDDYDHKGDWRKALEEGLAINPNGFVTLYDHPDKYYLYPNIASQVLVSHSCHWRTTPSTTNTYAFNFNALIKNMEVHYRFSQGVGISRDHHKFLELGTRGQFVISSIPGLSTHCDIGMISPHYA